MNQAVLVILDFTNGPAVTYPQGLEIQERIAAARRVGGIPDTLVLLEHEPVITYGKTAENANLLTSGQALGDHGIALGMECQVPRARSPCKLEKWIRSRH
jgi:lipoyl(octanoyl) transferase